MGILSSKLILSLIDRVTGPAAGIGGALRRLNGQIDRTNRGNMAMLAPMAGFAARLAMYGGAYVGVTQGIRGTAGAAISFESAMSDVRKVVDATDEQFANMKSDIIGLSRVMPVTAEGFASIYAAAAQSGVAQNELKGFAEGVVRMSTAWDTAVDTTGEALAKIKTALGRDIAGTMRLGDAINHVSNVSAASAPDILEYTNRVAAFAETAGFSAEQALAFGAAMVGSGFEPEVAATSFRNMSRALTMGTRATKAQRVAFKALGLDATKTAKRMQKDAVGTTLDVLDRIKKLPEYQQISIAGALFGEEARGLAPLVRDASELRRLLRETGDAARYSGSAFKEYVTRANTVGNVLQILRNKFADTFRGLGDDMLPSIKEGALGIGDVLDTLGERATVLDKVSASVRGFAQGLGYTGGVREAVNDLGNILFGKADGGGAADQLGELFMRAKGWGESLRSLNDAVRDSPLAGFFASIGAQGFQLAVAAMGISLLAAAVGRLAAALYLLSGAKAAVGILKALGKGGKWVANAAGLAGGAEAVADAANPKSKHPGGANTPTPPIAAGKGGWLKSLGLASVLAAFGTLVQSLGDTPGDTFADQVENNRQSREALQKLVDRITGPYTVPTGEWRAPGYEPPRTRGGVSDVRPMPSGPMPGTTKDLGAELRSMTLRTQQTGVADVRLTNPPPAPQVHTNVTVNVTSNASPSAIGTAVGDAVGADVKAALDASYSDGWA